MPSKEKIKHRIQHLKEKHRDLDKRIQLDMEPEYIMRTLKREKLELKDEIERLEDKLGDL